MRKPGSIVRERLRRIISVVGTTYGYEAYMIYKKVYGGVLLRTMYYNLKKGVEEGVFEVANLAEVPGDFTWGFQSNRIYYRNKGDVVVEKPEKERIEVAAKEIKKSIGEEVRKWIAEASNQMKGDMDPVERAKMMKKCRKIKEFYLENFGKYPKKLDKWIESLTP